MRIFIGGLFLVLFSGCVILPSSLFNTKPTEQEIRVKVSTFEDLLRAGWKIQVVQGRVVLFKDVNGNLLVQDIFGTRPYDR